MQIINASYKILTPISQNGVDELHKIEQIGRLCYKSEDKMTETSAAKFVEALIKRGHEAMIGALTIVSYIYSRPRSFS